MSPPERPAAPDDRPVGDLSFTEASRELDAIVEFFDQRDVDVDQLVARLERATAIVGELDRRIRRTRAQVEELVPRLESVGRGEDAGADPAGEDRPVSSRPEPDTRAADGPGGADEDDGDQLF